MTEFKATVETKMKKNAFEAPLVEDVEYECRDGNDHRQSGSPKVRMCRDCGEQVGKPHGRTCREWILAKWEHVVPHTDLRSITRDSELVETVVQITDEFDRFRHTWITCGQAAIRTPSDRSRHEFMLTCYLGRGATDFEHDSAYAFQLPLVGWQFESIFYSRVTFVAWVPSRIDHGGFRMPSAGYNPFELKDTGACDSEHCGDDHPHHPIVPEGHYIAPDNPELFKAVAGRKVRVTFGTPRNTEDRLERTLERIEELEDLLTTTVCKAHEAHDGELEECTDPVCDAVATKLAIKMEGVPFEPDGDSLIDTE